VETFPTYRYADPPLNQTSMSFIRQILNQYKKNRWGDDGYGWLNGTITNAALAPILQHTQTPLNICSAVKNYMGPTLQAIFGLSDKPQELDITPYNDGLDKSLTIKITTIKRGASIFPVLDDIIGVKEHKNISLALQEHKNHKVRCYLSERTLLVVTSEYNADTDRKIVALLPVIFPEQFGKLPAPMNELLNYLGKNDYTAWRAGMISWIDNFDLIKQKFVELINNKTKNHIISLQRSLSSTRNDISNYLKTLGDLYGKETDFIKRLAIYENTPEEEGADFYEYLKKHRFIKNFDIKNNNLYLDIITPLEFYDDTVLKAYYKSSKSIITEDNKIAQLFDEVFLKGKYQIYTCTKVRIDLGNNIYTKWNPDDSLMFAIRCNAIPHPHIMEMGCWGNNGAPIVKALSQQEYIPAIEQIVAATKNINWTDTTVVGRFISMLKGSYNIIPCIYQKPNVEGQPLMMIRPKEIFKQYSSNKEDCL
jgi:hypothetical protein